LEAALETFKVVGGELQIDGPDSKTFLSSDKVSPRYIDASRRVEKKTLPDPTPYILLFDMGRSLCSLFAVALCVLWVSFPLFSSVGAILWVFGGSLPPDIAELFLLLNPGRIYCAWVTVVVVKVKGTSHFFFFLLSLSGVPCVRTCVWRNVFMLPYIARPIGLFFKFIGT
jgi:hypothetical protein